MHFLSKLFIILKITQETGLEEEEKNNSNRGSRSQINISKNVENRFSLMLNKNVKNDTHPSELDGEEAHEEGGNDEKGAHHRPHHQER